ncbi:hypothetical protein K466DRAFT_569747 [Polyporus arcularius HHB13444]|uniref:Uncharacterized protein n=1 Tax=Polyporus arcularius HHB13444 TaxID=1314778 RepID=A0A5C3NTE0_9APHY|nr:hypothetical protein K466DRAFT_569747 [Polyporus arcularius HHB13444]
MHTSIEVGRRLQLRNSRAVLMQLLPAYVVHAVTRRDVVPSIQLPCTSPALDAFKTSSSSLRCAPYTPRKYPLSLCGSSRARSYAALLVDSGTRLYHPAETASASHKSAQSLIINAFWQIVYLAAAATSYSADITGKPGSHSNKLLRWVMTVTGRPVLAERRPRLAFRAASLIPLHRLEQLFVGRRPVWASLQGVDRMTKGTRSMRRRPPRLVSCRPHEAALPGTAVLEFRSAKSSWLLQRRDESVARNAGIPDAGLVGLCTNAYRDCPLLFDAEARLPAGCSQPARTLPGSAQDSVSPPPRADRLSSACELEDQSRRRRRRAGRQSTRNMQGYAQTSDEAGAVVAVENDVALGGMRKSDNRRPCIVRTRSPPERVAPTAESVSWQLQHPLEAVHERARNRSHNMFRANKYILERQKDSPRPLQAALK